jgi:hypothetical protein
MSHISEDVVKCLSSNSCTPFLEYREVCQLSYWPWSQASCHVEWSLMALFWSRSIACVKIVHFSQFYGINGAKFVIKDRYFGTGMWMKSVYEWSVQLVHISWISLSKWYWHTHSHHKIIFNVCFSVLGFSIQVHSLYTCLCFAVGYNGRCFLQGTANVFLTLWMCLLKFQPSALLLICGLAICYCREKRDIFGDFSHVIS